MPSQAKAYIAMIAALTVTVLAIVTFQLHPENLQRFALFFAGCA